MGYTIEDIAREAGVSRGTVDRVINKRGRVSPETKQHVSALLERYGYVPKRESKRSPARKSRYYIGCIVPPLNNGVMDKILNGIHQATRDFEAQGVTVLLERVDSYLVEDHLGAIERLAGQRHVDGLCVITLDDKRVTTRLNELIASGIPVITAHSDLTGSNRLCYLGCNPLESGSTAAGILRLCTGGCAEVAILTGSVTMHVYNQRVQGFYQTITKQSLEIRITAIEECVDNNDDTYLRTKEVLRKHPQITAFYLVGGGVPGVCRALEELGLTGKIKVVCHEDQPCILELVGSGAVDATIFQHAYLQGYRPIRLMVNYLTKGIVPEKDKYYTHSVIKIRENL